MKKYFLLFLLALFSNFTFSQIKGTVKDDKGNPLPFVNIYIKDTYTSTTSNDLGKFEFSIKTPGTYIILFQYVGFKTEKRIIQADNFPQIVEVVLYEDNFELNEVVINPKENPANQIIKKAIAKRKENGLKTAKYKADFYSRGIFRVKDLPKKFMGQKIDMFDDIIDSTRSGILYLSETISKITFQKPDKLKEIILASKVSGKDNGFSFNSAAQANFDFYENYLEFDTNVISPIADNAFNYYNYKFEGSIVDENNKIINKIRVISKRENEPAFNGYIYIEDDNYAIQAVDVTILGKQIQNPGLNSLTLKQNYSYNSVSKIWSKNTQTLDFEAGIFAFKFNGRFTYVYSNFEFPDSFEKKTFTNQVLKFEENANKKTDGFWETIRPVPLTIEETNDYIKKEKLQEKKKSKVYLDSIDKKHNKFSIDNIINGYDYKNSYKKWSINYDGPILNTSFNTVQGWNTSIGLSYTKRDEDKRTFTRFGTKLSYGFSDEKFRPTLFFTKKLNNFKNSFLSISTGRTVNQFNSQKPISNIVNTVSSLFFKNNFMKLYEKNFATINYGSEIFNGFYLNATVDYSERKPLFNTTNYATIKSSDLYSSNHPLLPTDFVNPIIEKHNLVKTSLNATINFGQKYWLRPDGKFNIGNDNYPTLNLNYEKGFASNEKKYEFDHLSLRLNQDFTIANKGTMQINSRVGTFLNADDISFVDYKHFNGNQTHIGQSDSYTNVFNLLPYYSSSTNKNYFETHIEHNDKGYFMNKIPLLKHLQSQLVLGFHNLSIENRKPYQEYSIGLDNLGFGKFKMFRVDYVRSYQNGFNTDGVVFGLKFLNAFE